MAVGQVFATPEDNEKWNNQRYVEKNEENQAAYDQFHFSSP